MTRTSLFKLADTAELWAVRVPNSTDVRIDDGGTLRFGADASPYQVAETIVRHKLGGAAAKDEDVQRELTSHGYVRSAPRRAAPKYTRGRVAFAR